MTHEGGHLPFEEDITSAVRFAGNYISGGSNRLTIAVNNTLTPTTLPPGDVIHGSEEDGYPAGYKTQVC